MQRTLPLSLLLALLVRGTAAIACSDGDTRCMNYECSQFCTSKLVSIP